MKTVSVLSIISSLFLASLCAASESHDLDRGLESSLRATLNDKHVHIHAHHGVVTLDGRVPAEADRERIEAVVRHTTGVVGVKDQLRVSLPSPAVLGQVPVSIPIYSTAPPEVVVPPTTVVATPAPVLIPRYPKLKVQAWTPDDQPAADGIIRELQLHPIVISGSDDVTITVRNGNAALMGVVDTGSDRQALISSIQHAGGVAAIYDQLRIR
jgi:hypothetical protein